MTIYGYKPKPWQAEVHQILKDNPKDTIVVVKSKRQCGKSMMLINQMLYTAFNTPFSTVISVSPTLGQARKMYKDIIKASIANPKVFYRTNEQLLELTTANYSQILFKSAEQREALRGYTADLVVMDEMAFIADDIFSLVVPWTNVKRAPMILCSTPRFKQGLFYDYYIEGQKEENDNIFTVDWNKYDTSEFLSTDKLETLKKTMPTQLFKTEYLGEFIGLESEVFGSIEHLIIPNAQPTNNMYAAVDWGTGSSSDYTAIVVMNEDRDLVYVDYFNDQDETQTIQRIIQTLKKYNVNKVTVEKNSIGNIFLSLLKKQIKKDKLKTQVNEFITTNESKNNIIENLQLAIQEETIHFIQCPELFLELSTYEVQLTKTNKKTYNASHGYHDDILMALAICLDSLTKGKYSII